MRISTAGLHAQGLQGMLQRQAAAVRIQEQLNSGSKLTRAAQDPAGAATAQRLDHAVAALEQFEKNAGLLTHRLRMQEQALDDSGEALTRVGELAIQANNPALSPADRKLLATELRQLRNELVGIANREDGSGRALFAGNRDGVKPFTDANGVVSYAGDDGRNLVDIGPDMAIADSDAGSAVFLHVRTGDGLVRGVAASANSGSGVLQASAVTDQAAWNGLAVRVEFTAPDAYQVLDAGGAVLATGAYVSGQPIVAGGVQFQLAGAPASGDAFVVERAPTRDIFATVQALADALEAPVTNAADGARQANAMHAAIADLATAQEHMFGLRAATGVRLASLDSAADTRSADSVTLAATLSQLRDVDFAAAASQLALELTALEAAQSTLVRVQSLSLFDRLG